MQNGKVSFSFEKMEEEEIAFLKKKFHRERKIFLRTMRNLGFLAFLVPTVVALLYFSSDQNTGDESQLEVAEPFTMIYYYVSLFSLLTLLFTGAYLSYIYTLKRIKKDFTNQIKIVERTRITRKHFMPMNKAYFFYIQSGYRLSIEVSESDFNLYEEGDELNIEYGKYSKEFLGYF